MRKTFLITGMLLVLGLAVGCSSDDPAVVTPTPPIGPTNPGGSLGIYSDTQGLSATVTDPGPAQLVTLYVVHKSALGVTAHCPSAAPGLPCSTPANYSE